MVVRHPFERLLSAYRDKLEDLSRDIEARDGYYFTMYGKQVQYSTVQHSTVQYSTGMGTRYNAGLLGNDW